MTYNGLDTRVGMTDSTGSPTFRRAGIGVTSPVLSDGSASFTPSGENRAGVKTAYHGGLKSFDTQTNSAQAVVGQRLTDAFGNQISSSGVWKGRFAYGGPYGYQEDPDTGLRLLGHRYYDSSTGRFLTRDPISNGNNWYVYCANNTVGYIDADGLKERPLTEKEKEQVRDAITRLAEDGYASDAAELEKLLNEGKIVFDDEYYGYAKTRFGKIWLGKIFFELFDAPSDWRYRNQHLRSGIVMAASVLLHELVHINWGNVFKWTEDKAERAAYQKQIEYLESVYPGMGTKLTSDLVENFLRDIVIPNAQSHGWKPKPTIGGGARRK